MPPGRALMSLPIRHALKLAPTPMRRLHHHARRPILQPLRQVPIGNEMQCRHNSIKQNTQKLFRENPISMTLASIFILIGASSIVYVNYFYAEYIIKPYHNYPEPVAQKLRRAVYFENYDVQPKEALKYFKQALKVAEELGMDYFSDEVQGIKIEVAGFMERIRQQELAVQVLERLREDNLRFLEGHGKMEENKKRRAAVLKKTVAITMKLGQLYSTPEVWDRDMAQERLVWALETSMKERIRRINQKVTDEQEGPWVSDEEMVAELELLASNYEAKDQHYLSTPLLLQAINLTTTKDCHSVILMNNLASSLAQQSPGAARQVQAYSQSQNITAQAVGPVATRETMVDNAKAWAQKALDVASTIKPPERTEECDVGCAVATHNLGEFAEMNENLALAKQKYQEAISLARAVGYEEGIEQSSARLRALAAPIA